MSVIEISVRRFYTSDEADVSPRLTVVIPTESLADGSIDWPALADGVAKMVADIPVVNLREMTAEEVKTYRENEAENG